MLLLSDTASERPVPRSGSMAAAASEMGARIAAFDWLKTSLGRAETWPRSLRATLGIVLSSRYPMFVWWGRDLVNFYNDAYSPMLGQRHPWALGQSAREIWREIWGTVGPQAESVIVRGQATWSEDQLLIMERNGYAEETYFTYSYSPITDDDGSIGGLFCAVIENTERVLGERRLRALRQLAATSDARTVESACALASRALADNAHDVAFALVYLREADGKRLRLASSAGIPSNHPWAPAEVDLAATHDEPWPYAKALAGQSTVLSGLPASAALPGGPWPEPVTTAMVLPLARRGQREEAGLIVVGASPRRAFDERYKSFFELVADGVANAIANAHGYEAETRRAEALAELDRQKTAFFSNVSHEFRTPLTLMLGPLEEEIARQDDSVSRERLEIAHRSSLRLLKLVNTLLDFSRLEAGRAQGSFAPIDLAHATEDIASVFRSAMEKAGLRFTVECAPLPEPVHVDRDMWEKIVLNLLSNALKHTFTGEVRVWLEWHGDHVALCVRDTGVGIPKDESDRVFERFHRVLGAHARSHEGTGIGLALVQELARLHGGDARVESELGKGSTFTVTVRTGNVHLPSGRAQATTLPSTAIGAPAYVEEAMRWLPEPDMGIDKPNGVASKSGTGPVPDATAGARILLVDDNADMRDYMRRLLGERWHVETASDGVEGLAAAFRDPPDLVLADVMMPGLDGFGLLRELRADPRTRTVPVVMVSARAGEEARVEGLEAGADDYLIKPFSARELVARVGTQLAMGRLRARTEEALREADRRKDEFLALLAHELRNPLMPIRLGAEILRSAGNMPAPAERARAVIDRQVTYMVRLIDDLLDVSRIPRGKLDLRSERMDLGAVVRVAVEDRRGTFEASRLSLDLSVPEAPVWIMGDGARIAQVVGNLLQNALKFTDAGGRVGVRLEIQDDAAVVRVADTGIGIAPSELTRIFEPFSQVDQSIGRSRGGLGLGLALVKGLVGLHGGNIRVHSEGPGLGSEFFVTLPLALAAVEGLAPDERKTPVSVQPLRVLIIEDNLDAAESLCALLRMRGHLARAVHSGAAGIAAARERKPDLVICDIGLPGGMDGYATARALRALPAGEAIHIIALTGYGQESDRARALDAGFDIHLTKPLDPATLERLMEKLPPVRRAKA
jgi:signal transduction histidine kinase